MSKVVVNTKIYQQDIRQENKLNHLRYSNIQILNTYN